MCQSKSRTRRWQMRRALVLLSVVVLPGIVLSAQSTSTVRRSVRPPAPAAQAASATRADTSRSVFSAERLARLDRLIQEYVDENRIAGAVALVLRDGQPAYERAIGW